MTMATDWELLNAYSDGELSPDDAKALEKRILHDPDLADALKQIETIGLALKPLHPTLPSKQTAPKTVVRPYLQVAIAASIALSIFVAAQAYFSPPPPQSPTDLHQAFLQMSFDVKANSSNAATLVAADPDRPDLSGANLTLVADFRNTEDTRALHYAGQNGCRLTLTISMKNAPVVKAEANLLLASWNVKSVYYTLLSTGMDANKFAAITQYVRVFSEQKDHSDSVASMRDATKNAVSCGTV